MGFFGDYFGVYSGDYFGDVGGVAATGPAGTLLPWQYESCAEKYSWLTDVTKTFSGKERRAALLGSMPAKHFEAEYLLDDYQERWLRARLVNSPVAVYHLPIRFDALLATAAVTGTTVTVTATGSADWAIAGQRVLLEDADGTQHATHITATTATTITINDAVPSTMPANLTAIMPLEPVYLLDGEATGNYTVDMAEWKLAARGIVFDDNFGLGTSLTSFDSLTVCDRRPVSESLAQEQSVANSWFGDYGAIVAVDGGYTRSDVKRSHEFAWHTVAERQWWRLFLNHCRGRFKTVLLPTWLDDLTASTTWSTTALTVYADDDHGNYISHWTHQTRLQIELANGEILHRKVNSYVDNGNGTQTLTLATANTGGSTTVSKISFLELVHLEGDQVVIQHQESRSRLSATFVVVQQ